MHSQAKSHRSDMLLQRPACLQQLPETASHEQGQKSGMLPWGHLYVISSSTFLVSKSKNLAL